MEYANGISLDKWINTLERCEWTRAHNEKYRRKWKRVTVFSPKTKESTPTVITNNESQEQSGCIAKDSTMDYFTSDMLKSIVTQLFDGD